MLKNIAVGLAMSVGFFSCNGTHKTENVKSRAIEYMHDKSKNELELVIEPVNQFYIEGCHHAQAQSKLDSVAYRDVFNATEALKDSILLAELNEIAQKAKPPSINESTLKLKNNLKNTRIRVRDYIKFSENHSNKLFTQGEKTASEYLQFITDSINYRRFFEKHNLFDTKTQELFHKVSQKIKP